MTLRPMKVRRGICQGDPLSPLIFNCVIDWALEEVDGGIGMDMQAHLAKLDSWLSYESYLIWHLQITYCSLPRQLQGAGKM